MRPEIARIYRFINPFLHPRKSVKTAGTKNPTFVQKAGLKLFHQQHLSSPFDGTVQLTLIMGRKTCVFARKNATLVSDELFEQVDVLEIKRVKSEIDFWFGTRCPVFHRTAFAAWLIFIFVDFAWHKRLFNFPMDRVTA
jgi:hypothetical protein